MPFRSALDYTADLLLVGTVSFQGLSFVHNAMIDFRSSPENGQSTVADAVKHRAGCDERLISAFVVLNTYPRQGCGHPHRTGVTKSN